MSVVLQPGIAAPGFSLLSTEIETSISLADYAGQQLTILFFPSNPSPALIKQLANYQVILSDFQSQDTVLIGLSSATKVELTRIATEADLKFPLLSDPDHKIALAYGAWGEKSMYGKTYEGIIRSSFLIGEDGKILQVSYKVKPLDTVPKAQAALS